MAGKFAAANGRLLRFIALFYHLFGILSSCIGFWFSET
jgi:hypothetical protein